MLAAFSVQAGLVDKVIFITRSMFSIQFSTLIDKINEKNP